METIKKPGFPRTGRINLELPKNAFKNIFSGNPILITKAIPATIKNSKGILCKISIDAFMLMALRTPTDMLKRIREHDNGVYSRILCHLFEITNKETYTLIGCVGENRKPIQVMSYEEIDVAVYTFLSPEEVSKLPKI